MNKIAYIPITTKKNGVTHRQKIAKGDQEKADFLGLGIQFSTEEIAAYKKANTPPPLTLDEKRQNLLHAIDQHDRSDKVNAFYLNGNKMPWLSKETRSAMMWDIQQAIEDTDATDVHLETPSGSILVEKHQAKALMTALHGYAREANKITQMHKRTVATLTDANIDTYDVTSGYPDIPRYTL